MKVQKFSLDQLLDFLSRRGTLKGDDAAKHTQLGQALNAIECLPDDGGYVNLTLDEQVMLLRRLNDPNPTVAIVQGGEPTPNAPNALPNATGERSQGSEDPIMNAIVTRVHEHFDQREPDYLSVINSISEERIAQIFKKSQMALAPVAPGK